MSEKNTRKQIRTLYLMTTVGYFQIAAASWVALLALRGFSLLQIGMLESIFHIVSLCFELPSGVVADVFGRRKTLIASQMASLISGTLMIFSTGFATTALALGCSALSYNLASGTREALAYDSLKQNGDEGFYARFSSTEMMLLYQRFFHDTLRFSAAVHIGGVKIVHSGGKVRIDHFTDLLQIQFSVLLRKAHHAKS